MARRDKYSEDRKANLQKEKSKKNARRKARKAKNAELRENGVKFVKKKTRSII